MQTEISLSTVEAECIALRQAMGDSVPFMEHMKAMNKFSGDDLVGPITYCTLF